jgi:hypothetical protein
MRRIALAIAALPADYAAQTSYVVEFQINFTVLQQFRT